MSDTPTLENGHVEAAPKMSSSSTDNSSKGTIHESWQGLLNEEFAQSYMQELREYLSTRKSQRAVVFPHSSLWFNAFSLTPKDNVKVVILGQDPYHGPGQAHGLSFSVPPGVRPPPSLLNMYKEIDASLGGGENRLQSSGRGCLEQWARQGVFLLNSVLTVEQGQAASHQGRGWELFTDTVIRHLSDTTEHLVFLLWGAYAQKKGSVIDAKRHLVLRAPHPSPLSAHRGFLGCGHFVKANEYLREHGKEPIDWFQVG